MCKPRKNIIYGGRNTAKERKFMAENPRVHEQINIKGECKSPRRKFDLWCDILIAPLILYLNENGIRTLYSCEGYEIKPQPSRCSKNGGYVTFTCPSPAKLALAIQAVKRFWKNQYVIIEADDHGRINCYQYNSKDSIIARANLMCREGVDDDD